ncbi:hypothetical protein B0H19DRAFT_1115440 [Mycena capillaripes]|nr:hypothetical protein B0H19DRAFT_1115440 [Mycena capillaripes]
MSTPFQDLAPELTFLILELSVRAYDVRRYCKPEREYEHLRNTALVCKAWASPSQMLLWRYVALRDPAQAGRWINSTTAGRYTTLGLSISGRGMGDLVLRLVLSRTVGLQTLDLVFFEPIPARCLALPELKDLTALVVSNSSVLEEGASDIPFRLRFFQTMHTQIHPTVIEELFKKSANTLECLELEQQHGMISPTLLGLYGYTNLVAPNLRALRITNAYSSIVPSLAACTSLRRLELTFEATPELATAIFKILPTPIEDLHVEAGRFSGGTLVLDDVARGLDYPSLSRLKRLHLQQDVIVESLQGTGGRVAEALLVKLKARSIQVVAIPER